METLRFVMTSTFYPPYHLGGDAVHVKYLAEELAARGHEVHVMFSRDAYRIKRKGEPKPVGQSKVHVHSLESPYGRLTPLRAYAFGNSSFVLKRYRKMVEDVKPDIVHHHNISLLGHGLLEKVGNYRQIYTAHDYWLVCQRSDLMKKGRVCSEARCKTCAISSGRPHQFWRKNLNIRELDCIICPSGYMQKRLESIADRTAVLHNFVPDPPSKIASSGKSDFFLFIGVLEPHKGVNLLLNAFAKNGKKLVLIGNGSLSQTVAKRIRDENLAPRIEYLGWAEDKWPYIRDANAVIIPSLWPENCPLVAPEAMSVGTPVICSDMGGTSEVVEKLDKQLVIPTGQLESRLAKIERPDIPRDAMIDTFRSNFSAEAYIRKYMEIVKGDCPST